MNDAGIRALIVGGNPIVGGNDGDILTINGGRLGSTPGGGGGPFATLGANTFTGLQTFSAGFLSNQTFAGVSGETTANSVLTTASGNVDGTSDQRGLLLRNAITGTNDLAGAIVVNNQTELQHATSTVALAIGMDTYVRLGLHGHPEFTGNATNVYGLRTHIANESAFGAIDRAYSLYVQAIDLADPVDPPRGTVNYAHGLHVDQQQGQPSLGPGVLLLPGRVQLEAIGVYVSDMNAGAALTASYFSHMNNNSPDQVTYPKYALYFDGSASSIHKGAMTVGDVIDPTGTAIFQIRQSIEAQVTGTYFGINELINVQGDPSATGDFRGFRQNIQFVGTNGIASVELFSTALNLNSSGGTIAAANGMEGTIAVNDANNVTAITANTWGIFHNSNATVTSAIGYSARIAFQAGTGTIVNTKGFSTGEIGGTRVTGTAIGIDLANISLISGGGVVAALQAAVSNDTNKWNILVPGTAPSAFTGYAKFGATTVPAANIDILGNVTKAFLLTIPVGSVAANADQYPWDYVADYAGDPGGTSSYRTMRLINRVSGTADMDQIHGTYFGLMDERTAGTTFVNYTHHSYNLLHGAGNVSNGYVHYAHFGLGSHDNDSSGSFSVAVVYQAGDTAWITDHTATGTVSSMTGFRTGQLGHATRVANLAAFRAEDDVAASTAVAFLSQYTPGTGKLAFKDEGLAGSLFGGPVNVGDLVAPVDTSLQVRRSGVTLGTSSVTGSVLNGVSSVTPNADGLTDYRSIRNSTTITGANSMANVTGINNTVTLSATAGTTAAASGIAVTMSASSTATTTRIRGIDSQIRLASDGITTTAEGLYARVLKTAGTTGTIGTSRGLHVDDGGGSHVTAEAIGVDVENFTNITGGGVKAAFRTKMNSGTNAWAVRTEGTAPSSFGGTVTTIASSTTFAGLNIPHGAAPTSPVNGDMWTTTAGAFIRINGVTKTFTLT